MFMLFALKDRLQLWMGLFLLGLLFSFFAGRVYCGWVCPIHPVLRALVWLRKNLKIDQSDCIASGQCQSVCPAQAVSSTKERLAPHGDDGDCAS